MKTKITIALFAALTSFSLHAEENLRGYCNKPALKLSMDVLKGKGLMKVNAVTLPADTLIDDRFESGANGITVVETEVLWQGTTVPEKNFRMIAKFGLNGNRCFLIELSQQPL
jgi:hypothetical protein